MTKIVKSLSMIAFVAAVALAGTGAYFSDKEVSTGNVFTAGAIDLGIDNESYYNGVLNPGTSWILDWDISTTEVAGAPVETGRQFFNFTDLKPGDYGEDTISIHVKNNPSWVCAYTTITTDDDMDCTEPELEDDDTCDELNTATNDGDLADEIQIMWWADDGDNVLESNETVLSIGNLGQAPIGAPIGVTLADSVNNIWSGASDTPLHTPNADDMVYIAKAWCFGTIGELPVTQDNSGTTMTPAGNNDGNSIAGEPTDGGFTCTGASVISNASQSDSVTLDVEFYAVQARNNSTFECADHIPTT